MYLNNTMAMLRDIGEGVNALHCHTNNEDCCRKSRLGQFSYPSGSFVPISSRRRNFYRNRDVGVIRLNRRNDATTPTGVYSCEIPDATGEMQKIYIKLI